MKVIVTGGGTGGHIYPALSIINKIKEMEPDSDFIYIGTHNRMEKDIVPANGIKYESIEIYGLSSSMKLMKRNVKNVMLINKAYKKCLKIIKDFNPDIVIGVGGYVTYPVLKAAHKLNKKIFIHEQNSIPGKSNKWLSRYASLIGVSMPDSLKYFDKRAFLSGNPCGENALKIKKISKEKYGLTKDKKSILIFSGSLGSNVVNKKMIEFLSSIKDEEYEVLYITGKNYYEEFKKNKFSKNVFIVEYVDNLSGLMKDMDLIISRAGASTLAEIMTLRKPSILIPSPYVANNHQYYNALSIFNENAGIMLEEKDLNANSLKESINKILTDEKYYKEIEKNLARISIDNASSEIYKRIKDLIEKK